MKVLEKKEALLLRKKGESIKEIAKKLSVSKSSVSTWVRNIHLAEDTVKELRLRGHTSIVIEKRRVTRLANEQIKREVVMNEAASDIKGISLNELRIVGLCLYWGEGSKTNQGSARVSNGDPSVIKVMMRFFREVVKVNEAKFRGHIHIHSHLNAEEAEKYWVGVSGIPRAQFYKTYTKQSIASKGKKDNLPYGTFDIYVCSTKTFLQIMGQIKKIKELLIV